MRTAIEIRERAVATLGSMLSRPSMHGVGQSFETVVLSQLSDLAFIDAREGELGILFAALEAQGLFGPLRSWGAVAGAFADSSDHTDRLASIYARIASQLGYFAPVRRLSATEWHEANDVATWARKAPRLSAHVEARFGTPSYRGLGQAPRVFAYAGPTDDAWLYFDFDGTIDGRLVAVRRPVYPFRDSVVDLRMRRGDGDSAEDAYRRFLIALLSGDADQLLPLVVAHEDPATLCRAPYPADVASLLKSRYEQMDVVRVDAESQAVVLVSDGCPVPLTVIREEGSWRVDADPLIRVRQRAVSTRTDRK
jgi:hypothetical protein